MGQVRVASWSEQYQGLLGWFCVLLISGVLIAPARPALAQDKMPGQESQSAQLPQNKTSRFFSIPSQPLADALTTFGQQAGLQVTLNASITAGLSTRGVSGTYEPEAALRILLEGTGLTYRFTNANTVMVERPLLQQGGERFHMEPTLVEGQKNIMASERPVEGYVATRSTTATKTDTPLREVPQSVTVVTQELIKDQAMQGMADVVRYVPGVTMGQGEGHRDAPTIRGNSSTADFFIDGVRDDVQYFRDLYNVDRVEVLKGPNAMIFGRGGGGGVINRVTKEADWTTVREMTVQGSSYGTKRLTTDVGQGLNDTVAFRLNGLFEHSDSYRAHVDLERYGMNPTVTIALTDQTRLKLSYEYFGDYRTVDRGIPSFEGRPADTLVAKFFGDPDRSHANTTIHAGTAVLQHEFRKGLLLRNHLRYAEYDKFYQNIFPGAVTPDRTQVNISGYNNGTQRQNFFNQTDLIYTLQWGSMKHTLLAGFEAGFQDTDNLRTTAFFNNTDTSVLAPFGHPIIHLPITFRPNATDANNHVENSVLAAYVQDQIELLPQLHGVFGFRYDRFDLDFHNNRDNTDLSRKDDLFEPRLGLIFEPIDTLSLYTSYSVSYLPSAGDQFSSLTATSKTLKPEKFTNYEVGAKWDIFRNFLLTTAIYELDRDNTTARDPNDPARIVPTGSQRTRGFELGLMGNVTEAWQIMGGYAYQDAEITSATTNARKGATVPLVPHNTFSLWNKYQLMPRLGAALGIIYQDDMYAAVDNAVTLPSFVRLDAAVYFRISDNLFAQVNVQNLIGDEYYTTAHSNNNITPGTSRVAFMSVTANF